MLTSNVKCQIQPRPLGLPYIGAGQNIGENTALALKAKGYKVAVGSRKPEIEKRKKEGYFPVTVDGGSTESVKSAFVHVNKELGPPSVVILNVASFVPAPEDPLSLPLEALKQQTDLALAVYVAAQEAIAGFRSETLMGIPTTFIVTGNLLPWIPAIPLYFGVNIQKTIIWRLLKFFSGAYAKENVRFYFATLVGNTGGVIDDYNIFATSGPQHAQVYLDLVTREDQADWDYRFTADGKQWTK